MTENKVPFDDLIYISHVINEKIVRDHAYEKHCLDEKQIEAMEYALMLRWAEIRINRRFTRPVSIKDKP